MVLCLQPTVSFHPAPFISLSLFPRSPLTLSADKSHNIVFSLKKNALSRREDTTNIKLYCCCGKLTLVRSLSLTLLACIVLILLQTLCVVVFFIIIIYCTIITSCKLKKVKRKVCDTCVGNMEHRWYVTNFYFCVQIKAKLCKVCVVFWFFPPKLMLPNLEDVAEIIAASPLCNKCNMNANQLRFQKLKMVLSA